MGLFVLSSARPSFLQLHAWKSSCCLSIKHINEPWAFEWRHKRIMAPQRNRHTKDAVANCAQMRLILISPHKCISGIKDRTVPSVFWTPDVLIHSSTFAFIVFNMINTYSWLLFYNPLRSSINLIQHKIKQTFIANKCHFKVKVYSHGYVLCKYWMCIF